MEWRQRVLRVDVSLLDSVARGQRDTILEQPALDDTMAIAPSVYE